MRGGTVALAFVIIGAMVSGCAYYNGLYNANRLAKDAEQAEREGRESDARSLWAQVAVKAESVVARYPQSKHRDDALLLRGKALRATGDCAQAIEPLTQSLVSSPDSTIRTNSRLLLLFQFRTPEFIVEFGGWVDKDQTSHIIGVLSSK